MASSSLLNFQEATGQGFPGLEELAVFSFLVQMEQLGPTPMGWELAATMGKGPGEARNFCISSKLPRDADTAGHTAQRDSRSLWLLLCCHSVFM